jgi:CO/xanthine dehydrogenase FAD-binding subunit
VNGAKNATYEIRHRQGLDWPYVTASVAKTNGGTKIVLGHVAPTPVVVTGNDPAAGAKPLSGNAYKVKMVKTAVKRALAAASNGAKN